MKNLIVLSFGKEIEWQRAIFSVLSFWSWYEVNTERVRVIIYTDNEDYIKNHLHDFNINYVQIPSSEIQKNQGYLYKLKISAIEKTFQQYPADDLVFIDTDTFFNSDPRQLLDGIKPGKSFMHLREYTFEEAVDIYRGFDTGNAEKYPIAFLNIIESELFKIGEKEVKLNRHQHVWNSGVLGLSHNIATYIPDVYALTDEFYSKTLWRISEQLAFTVILNQTSTITESGNYIIHYWHYKDRVDGRIIDLLDNAFMQLTRSEKIATVKRQTLKLTKLLNHEQMLTNAKIAMRKKDYKNSVLFVAKAIAKVPMNDDFMKILKYRFTQLSTH